MPFCTECGAEVRPQDRFCHRCGAPTLAAGINATTQVAAPVTAVQVGTPPATATTRVQHHAAAPVAGTPLEAAHQVAKVSSKYAFAVVGLLGLIATALIVAGMFTPVVVSTNDDSLHLTLNDMAFSTKVCKKAVDKAYDAFCLAVTAAVIAALGTCASAVTPLTWRHDLPLYGGIVIGFASFFALISGSMAVSIYTEPLCDSKAASSVVDLLIGPGPVLLMVSVLFLIGGAIAAVVMRQPWTAQMVRAGATGAASGDRQTTTAAAADGELQTVSSKYAFAVVGISGLLSLPLLGVGVAMPIFDGTVCAPTFEGQTICIQANHTTLFDIAQDATCDAKSKAEAAIALAIVAAAAGLAGALVSASSPFSAEHTRPLSGGKFMWFGSVCAAAAGILTIGLYSQPICGNDSPSSMNFKIGPAPILLMVALLPQTVGFVASLVMKKVDIPDPAQQVRYDPEDTDNKTPAKMLMFIAAVSITMFIGAGTSDVYELSTKKLEVTILNVITVVTEHSPTLLEAAKHGMCDLESTRATAAFAFLIASAIGTGWSFVLGYLALVMGSRRLVVRGALLLGISGVLSLVSGAAAVSLFTSKVCFSTSINSLGGTLATAPMLLMGSAMLQLVFSLIALCSVAQVEANPLDDATVPLFARQQSQSYNTTSHAAAADEEDESQPTTTEEAANPPAASDEGSIQVTATLQSEATAAPAAEEGGSEPTTTTASE